MNYESLERHFAKGLLISRAMIGTELHRLLAIMLASERFAELRGGDEEKDHPIALLQQGEPEEVKRILLYCAAAIRALDDSEGRVAELFVYGCGQINYRDGTTEGLSVRDACNKILHAISMQPELKKARNGNHCYSGVIKLRSVDDQKKNRKNWEVDLNVIDFCREALQFVHLFDPGVQQR